MKVYGLTGGIASGKSTVANYFKNAGIPVLDADKIVHQIYRKGSRYYQQIVDHFGPAILNRSKQINRKKLGAIILNFPKKKKWLEAIIHPATIDMIQHKLKKISQQGHAFAIVEAALLLESGYHRLFDGMIVVYVDEPTQIKRLMRRNQLEAREANQWIASQWPMKKKLKYADYKINNSGNRKQCKQLVMDLIAHLQG